MGGYVYGVVLPCCSACTDGCSISVVSMGGAPMWVLESFVVCALDLGVFFWFGFEVEVLTVCGLGCFLWRGQF